MPSLVFGVAVIASMIGLAVALRTIPTGTGYAVWVGIGGALTAAYAMCSRDEPTSAQATLVPAAWAS